VIFRARSDRYARRDSARLSARGGAGEAGHRSAGRRKTRRNIKTDYKESSICAVSKSGRLVQKVPKLETAPGPRGRSAALRPPVRVSKPYLEVTSRPKYMTRPWSALALCASSSIGTTYLRIRPQEGLPVFGASVVILTRIRWAHQPLVTILRVLAIFKQAAETVRDVSRAMEHDSKLDQLLEVTCDGSWNPDTFRDVVAALRDFSAQAVFGMRTDAEGCGDASFAFRCPPILQRGLPVPRSYTATLDCHRKHYVTVQYHYTLRSSSARSYSRLPVVVVSGGESVLVRLVLLLYVMQRGRRRPPGEQGLDGGGVDRVVAACQHPSIWFIGSISYV